MSRRPHVLAPALALVAAVLAVVGAPASTGAPAPCTVIYSAKPGSIKPKEPTQHSWNPFNIEVTDPRVVGDIDIAIDIEHPQVADLSIHLLTSATVSLAPNVKAINQGAAAGAVNGRYVFDDEAPSGQTLGTNSPPGRYRPQGPASEAEGAPGDAKGWSLWILNYGELSGTVRSVAVTITFTTCDSDGDGVEDSVDNCLDVPNSDQASNDDDPVGNACDIDDDNDGLDDVDDPCPVAAGPRGCPVASRAARLAHKAKAKRLVVTVRSATRQCRAAKVIVHRVRKGKDPRAASGRTDAKGVLKVKVPRKPGTYYAKVVSSVVPGVAECRGARTKRVTVRRR